MTEAKRALAEAKRAELLLRSPVMQKQPRELTEAQKAALASKGVLKELVAENDLGSGGGGDGGGTGVLEAIAAVEVGEGLGGLLSTAAAITVVGVCVGGLYMMMRRR
jgi:microcystin degradation protein MlrC